MACEWREPVEKRDGASEAEAERSDDIHAEPVTSESSSDETAPTTPTEAMSLDSPARHCFLTYASRSILDTLEISDGAVDEESCIEAAEVRVTRDWGVSWMVSCDVCDARDGVLENGNERAVCRGGVVSKLGIFSGEEGMLSPSSSDADRLLPPSKSTPSSSPSSASKWGGASPSSMSSNGCESAEASMLEMAFARPVWSSSRSAVRSQVEQRLRRDRKVVS